MRERFVFMAAPYLGHAVDIDTAFEEATAALVAFHREEIPVYAPTVQWHHVARYGGLDTGGPVWARLHESFLNNADALVVLKLEGWEKSHGVAQEIARAEMRGIPIFRCFVGEVPIELVRMFRTPRKTHAHPIPDENFSLYHENPVSAAKSTLLDPATPGEQIIEGMENALAHARGDQSAAKIVHLPSPFHPKPRKNYPMMRGLLDYFPDACAAVANCSYVSNDQHNSGEPLHWAREKSDDHVDCAVRHLMERGSVDGDGVRHSAKAAWRALANLQLEIEAEKC